MITLEEENMQAVYEHIRNVPLDFSDFESLHFSTGSSSYNSVNTSQMMDYNKVGNQMSPDVQDDSQNLNAGADCPFDEFNS